MNAGAVGVILGNVQVGAQLEVGKSCDAVPDDPFADELHAPRVFLHIHKRRQMSLRDDSLRRDLKTIQRLVADITNPYSGADKTNNALELLRSAMRTAGPKIEQELNRQRLYLDIGVVDA